MHPLFNSLILLKLWEGVWEYTTLMVFILKVDPPPHPFSVAPPSPDLVTSWGLWFKNARKLMGVLECCQTQHGKLCNYDLST